MTKILNIFRLSEIIKCHKCLGDKIIFTNGCFDILHIGHITYLREAKSLGDILVVAINSDNSVRRLKGNNRPIVPEFQRAEIIAELECVNYVTIFDDLSPLALIRKTMPDVLVKGGDYSKHDIVGSDFIISTGGTVHITNFYGNCSSTTILKRICNL